MGVRRWLRNLSSRAYEPQEQDGVSEPKIDEQQVFGDLQEQRTNEALALFDEPEEHQEDSTDVAAPYDASHAELDDLMNESEHEAFTHVDEVQIEDVGALEDPYESARIEGDVPEMVVFDDGENEPSV